MSIPMGKINDLPIGAQLCANYFQENNIFMLSELIENQFSN